MPLSLVGNILGSAMTNITNQALQKETNELNYKMFQEQQAYEAEQARLVREFNKQESELAFEREKEMWNMQNEYNTPLAQMQRYQDAGLNPNLIYGQGSPGNATSAPTYTPSQAQKPNAVSRPEMKMTNLTNMLENLPQYQLLTKQSENQEEITRGLRLDNDFKEKTMDYRLHSQHLKNLLDEGAISRQEYENKLLDIEYRFNDVTFQDRVNQVKLQNELSKLDRQVKLNIIDMHKYNVENIKNQNERLEADIQLLQHQLGKKEFNKWVHDTTGIDLDNASLPQAIMGLTGKLGATLINAIDYAIKNLKFW